MPARDCTAISRTTALRHRGMRVRHEWRRVSGFVLRRRGNVAPCCAGIHHGSRGGVKMGGVVRGVSPGVGSFGENWGVAPCCGCGRVGIRLRKSTPLPFRWVVRGCVVFQDENACGRAPARSFARRGGLRAARHGRAPKLVEAEEGTGVALDSFIGGKIGRMERVDVMRRGRCTVPAVGSTCGGRRANGAASVGW